MEKNILTELELKMQERHIKVPALSVKLGIPKDRIYKWYQQGTEPKTKDALKVWDWINGKDEEEYPFIAGEAETPYQNANMPTLIKIIEMHIKTIESQQALLQKQHDTIDILIRKNDGRAASA